MLISAHDYQNKVGGLNNSAVTANTPAWELGWHAQLNVTAAIVRATGGTYALGQPEEKPKTRKTTKK